MSNQPYGYEGHQGYDEYQRAQQYGAAAQPEWQGYDEGRAAQAQQYTQQWEGQTWETQIQPQTPPAGHPTETAYLPQQPDGPSARYGQQPGQDGQQGQPTPYDPYNSYDPYGQQVPQASQPPQAPQPTPAQAPVPPPADPAATPDPGYGPPTLTGNTRVTDAQRARAEGRSPIIEPGMQPALITAVLGLLLAGAAAIGEYALAVPLVILQAVTAAGWFRLNGMWPARQGIVLAFAGALAADAALFAAGREHAPAAILGTLGVWVLLALVLGLRSHADPDERMYGLMATVASAALSIIATGHLAAEADAVTVGGVAVAVAVVARALPLPTPASVVVALLAATGAGIAVGGATDLGTSGALLGAGAGVCALIGHRVAAYDYPSRFVHFTAGVALPLTAAAPAVYLLGRALT
ncbi:hypothetical protein PV332_17075 [Streptomyces scabiei]|nr:hypothetical protein [Streptomyces scabiei]MDX2537639.1 hypothetical protein [Streptomyces scabiei]MDX2577166.1 hypothetical protein [Streptomyces scabiei]MDX2655978.1 hypothetical protein [Streptomyces scabiei]MDX2721713.1 hypothetical protein [Streptomyces scabiei]MDX2797722.1 hypothetical protein [Streptomyces scabiei]